MNSNKMPVSIEWMNKIWYIDTMEFYSALKQNLSFVGKGTHLDIIKLSKLYQSKNEIYCMFPHL